MKSLFFTGKAENIFLNRLPITEAVPDNFN